MYFSEENVQYLDILRNALKKGRLTDYRHLSDALNEIFEEEIRDGKMKRFNIPNCGSCIRSAIKRLLLRYDEYQMLKATCDALEDAIESDDDTVENTDTTDNTTENVESDESNDVTDTTDNTDTTDDTVEKTESDDNTTENDEGQPNEEVKTEIRQTVNKIKKKATAKKKNGKTKR